MKHLLLLVPFLLPLSVCWAGQGGYSTQEEKIPHIPHGDLSYDTTKHHVGGGSFGQVYRGTWQGREVAIKKLPPQTMTDPKFKEDFQRETEVAWKCQFPHIVKLYGVCTDPTNPAMVFELMPLSLNARLKQPMEDAQKWRIAIDIAKGLAYLHSNNVIHRDLKSHNILLTNNERAKICDFGLSKSRDETIKNTGVMGTIAWCAPELFQYPPPENITQAMDMYSYGMILWELVCQKEPFSNINYQGICGIKVQKRHETIPADCHPVLTSVMEDCWKDPDKRPRALDVFERLEKANPYPQKRPAWLSAHDPDPFSIKAIGYTLYPGARQDWQQVLDCYKHHPVPGYDVAKVEVIFNPDMNSAFKGRMGLLQQRQGNARYTPTWRQDGHEDWRKKVNDQLENMAKPYTQDDYPDVKLIPLWHGTKKENLKSLLSSGYTAFCTTDHGYFGKGLYGAHEARYANMYATSSGILILNWATLYSAYPIICQDYDSKAKKLITTKPLEKYDGHFIPVISSPKGSMNCIPPQPMTDHEFTEVMLKDASQIIPRYLVTLQPTLTKTPGSSQLGLFSDGEREAIIQEEKHQRRLLKQRYQSIYKDASSDGTEVGDLTKELDFLKQQVIEEKELNKKKESEKQALRDALETKTQALNQQINDMEEQRALLEKEKAKSQKIQDAQDQLQQQLTAEQRASQEKDEYIKDLQMKLAEWEAVGKKTGSVQSPVASPKTDKAQVVVASSPTSTPPAPLVRQVSTAYPDVAKGYEDVYDLFMNAKLIYTHPQTKKTTEWVFGSIMPQLFQGGRTSVPFDLSGCDADIQKYVSINLGFRVNKNPDNEDKTEVWLILWFWLAAHINGSAAHYKPVFDKWETTYPAGIFWTGGWWNDKDGDCDYLINQGYDKLSDNNLYEKWRQGVCEAVGSTLGSRDFQILFVK